MTKDKTQPLHDTWHGATARVLLADILALAEREGILDQMRRHSPFSHEELCQALQSEVGYSLAKGNRRRMIRLLVDLFVECGRLREANGLWRWDETFEAPAPEPAAESTADGQYRFFRDCLNAVPSYLRTEASSMAFDEKSAVAWEDFLGCVEFRTCRGILLGLMGIRNAKEVRVLDLCHGPGWDLEAVIHRFPAVRITALDFTAAFSARARERAAAAQEAARGSGAAVSPVTWLDPAHWKGFRDPLPFSDASFEAVFFSCGDPYIPGDRRMPLYRDIARVLAPGGTLGILTRCRPDAGGRHVPFVWLRIASLAHDFAESVCEGWEGFCEAEENMRLFSDVGFRGGVPHLGSMSVLGSSLWVLTKGGRNE